MAHYTVQSSSSQNRKIFRICGYGLVLLMLVVLGVSQTDWLDDRWSHPLGWGAMGLLGLAMIGVFVLIFKESMDKYWQKVSFDIDKSKIVRTIEGQTSIEFPLNEVRFIGESRTGLIVRGGEPTKSFAVPRSVERFEELKEQLSEHCEVVPTKTRNSTFLAIPLVLIIALYLLLFTAKNKGVVLAAGAAALLFQGWAIFRMRKIWARTSSSKLVATASILCWLVLLWIVYQRFFLRP